MGSSKTILRTDWFTIEEEHLEGMPAFKGKPFYKISAPDNVIVLALTEQKEIVLVRQFRPALGRQTLELPAGAMEEGEAPAAAAVRELREETGYVCKQMTYLGQGGIMLSRLTSREFTFCGTGATRDPAFRPQEDIEVVLASPSEFKRLVLSAESEQLITLGVVLLADWRLGLNLAGRNAGLRAGARNKTDR